MHADKRWRIAAWMGLSLSLVAGCRCNKPTPPALSGSDAGPADGSAAADSSAMDAMTAMTTNLDAGAGGKPPVFSREIERLQLLANGHVLLSAQVGIDEWSLYDWDATVTPAHTPVRVDIAAEGAKAHRPLLRSHPPFFFTIERMRENAATKKVQRTLELWDAERLAKSRDLSGSWTDVQTGSSFSKDGRRFLFAACANEGADLSWEWEVCEVSVYALPAGDLVHRTKLPRLRFERYFATFPLSPSGKYFGFVHPELSAMVYDAATGKLLFPADGSAIPDFGASDRHEMVFLDDQRVITTSHFNEKLTATSLPDGEELGAVDFKLSKGESSFRSEMSPDRKRVATALKLNSGNKVAIWNLEDFSLKKHAISKSICPLFCHNEWVGPSSNEQDVWPEQSGAGVTRPATRMRLNIDTGAQSTDPSKMQPSFEKAGFKIFSETDRSAEGTATADAQAATDTIVTPTGLSLQLPAAPPNFRGIFIDVIGERLLIATAHVVRVIAKDGSVSELSVKPY